MDDYSPIMIGAVVLVAFIAGYSIISYVIKRFKSDAARSRGDHDPTAGKREDESKEPWHR
jgi:hypothetical protein